MSAREERAELVGKLLGVLMGELPPHWTMQQLTQFFLACAVGHARVSGSMTTAEMVEYVKQLPADD